MTRSGVDCCTGIALTILCGPCICLYFGLTACFCPSRLRRRPCVHDPKANFEKRQRSAPRPALRRKRALTLPLPEHSSGVLSEKPTQRTYDQQQSRLFKLPLELREQIYREVLSGPPIHIIRKQKKLGHLRCKAIRPEDCPVKYSESINILYTHNTFSLNDLDSLRYLSSTLIPPRLALIKTLHLHWSFTEPLYDIVHELFRDAGLYTSLYPPHDEATWEECWRIISTQMTGLREIRVAITDGPGRWDETQERKMLEPLRKVNMSSGGSFEIALPWQGTYRHARDAPFTIVRPVPDDDTDSSDDD
ncbi:hypothetical protein H2201_004530 [Coniosporium apollinis]|uniref:DUF7730 domain-containing protein n=2 Tax=Coniosporium TaxID=2810619 RepID=A0ABQ9NZA6_9PEZI|nr:hypothetical protein H2199_005210 [Cladosporium sp. JES 115]KAJ9665452.1 hypothetical protein H2201_004530 [Coniosporium apollinis]